MRKFVDILFVVLIVAFMVCFLPLAKATMFNVFFAEVYTKAIKGNSSEQFRLGMLYQLGKFTERNEKEAIYWFKRAAHSGDRTANDILCRDYKICP